ncbi:hypothetical protein KQ246_16170 [Pseudoalteromonas shioyasakiensis]|nr:hypothetical protein KQ246_16170 [Pseudoalteromonas shioyasakiensis]
MDSYKKFFTEFDKPSELEYFPSLFRELLAFLKDEISSSRKAKLNVNYIQSGLFRDILSQNSKHSVFKEANKNNYNGVAQFCYVIEKLFKIKSIDGISMSVWNIVFSEMVKGDTFYPETGAKFLNIFRLLSNLLVKHTDNNEFKVRNISDPHKKKSGNKGSQTTFGKLLVKHPTYSQWFDASNKFINEKILKSQKSQKSALAKFITFVIEEHKILDPIVYFSEKRSDFLVWLENNNVKDKLVTCKTSQEFSIWFINNHMTDYTDEPVALGYPLFDDIRYQHVLKQSNDYNKKRFETNKHPMPTKYVQLCQNIISENDYKWPKSLDSENYYQFNEFLGINEKKWCPVNSILFSLMFELPLRKIQFTSLDSGEGDELTYNHKAKKWEDNQSTNSGYWLNIGANKQSRGFLSQSETDQTKVDLYVNTNKTEDQKNQFDENSGYRIPWHNESAIELANFLRKWQELNNPINGPTAYSELPKNTFSSEPTDAAIEMLPDRFYLFRSHLNTSSSEAPIADYRTFKFWHQLMDELEKRLKIQGEEHRIVIKRDKNGFPKESIFTPHGLRVTGLTSFMEAGVPIEILSKIVAGHKSILMTLHYIKYNNTHISQILSEAHYKIEQKAQENYAKWLMEASWTDAEKYSVFNDENTFSTFWNSKNTSSTEIRECGICPTMGTTCNIGGKLIRSNASNNNKGLYEAVEGGEGNCIMCRFFITGKAWLIPLWIKTNVLLAESKKLAITLESHQCKLELLKKERFKFVKEQNPIPPELKAKIQSLDGIVSKESTRLDKKLREAHRAYNLLEKVRCLEELKEKTEDNSQSLILLNSENSGDFIFDETSSFRQLDFIVQGGRLFDELDLELFEKDRNNFIDTFLFNSGMTPITLSPLTEDEKKAATDAAAKLLTTQLTDAELEQLESNSVTLKELGYASKIQNEMQLSVEQQKLKIPVVNLD